MRHPGLYPTCGLGQHHQRDLGGHSARCRQHLRLYQSRLRVVTPQTGQQNISATAVPTSVIGRMMASYSVASSLTPLPVISSSSVGYSYATAGASSPLQLHSQLTRGLTFLTQQLQNLTTQPTTASQVLPAIQSALTQSASSTVVGLNDAYALFASAADTGSVDFSNMASSVVGMLAQDSSSLPQLSPVSTQAARRHWPWTLWELKRRTAQQHFRPRRR